MHFCSLFSGPWLDNNEVFWMQEEDLLQVSLVALRVSDAVGTNQRVGREQTRQVCVSCFSAKLHLALWIIANAVVVVVAATAVVVVVVVVAATAVVVVVVVAATAAVVVNSSSVQPRQLADLEGMSIIQCFA